MAALVALIASACISAPVSYAGWPDAGAPHIPWIHAGPVTGYLFYYGAPGPWKTQRDHVLITPGGGVTDAYNTKILWHVPTEGCWRVTVSSEKRVGRFAFVALAP